MVKVGAMVVSDERRFVQMIAERGVRFCAPPAGRAGAQPWLRGKCAGRSAASRNPRPNPRQALHAYGPSIASEPLDAVIVFVKAEVFNKDQSPISLTLDHREAHFRDHARAQLQKI